MLGALSDRFGRRSVLVVSAFGFAGDLVLMALAPTVGWLILGRIISGLTAGSFAAASAYVADVTEPAKRSARFGLFSAVFSAGMIIGPAAGGLLGQFGPRAPFWAAAALAAAMALYSLLFLPESLPRQKRGEVRGLNPFAPFGILLRAGQPPLAAITAFLGLASASVNTIFVLYVDHRYGWGVGEAGLLLTAFGVGNMVVMGAIAPLVARRAGERAATILGLALSAVGFVAIALASTPLLFCLACVPTCLGNLCGPAVRAMHTNLVPDTEQGRLQGALGGLQALTGLVGPIAFTQVFAAAIAHPGGSGGGSMLVGAALLVCALVVAFTLRRPPKPA